MTMKDTVLSEAPLDWSSFKWLSLSYSEPNDDDNNERHRTHL